MALTIEKQLHPSWRAIIGDIVTSDLMVRTMAAVRKDKESSGKTIWPRLPNVFRAFSLCTAENIKCIIVGQDPYHTPGKANGLAFAVSGPPAPPSLKNIYAELCKEYGEGYHLDASLEHWASQGVLLLNRSLTVREGEAGSHAEIWKEVTARILAAVTLNVDRPLVIMLWGKHAQSAKAFMSKKSHAGENRYFLETTHPSPFSADKGFLGCGHFLQANKLLSHHNVEPILWLKVPE